MTEKNHAYLRGIGAYVPANRVSNDDLAKTVDTSDEWIYSHTGIKNRHLADPAEATSDLAVKAARMALEEAGITAKDLDFIIVATVTQDYIGFPSTACLVQKELEAHQCGAMDISAACSGFIYGLETARVFIESGTYKNILVIGAEILSRIVDWSDRNTCVLFGDGAGAAIVSAGDASVASLLSPAILAAKGKDFDALYRPTGGSRKPFDPATMTHKDLNLIMDGKRVYMFAVNALGKTAEEIMKKNNLTVDDIDYIVPHQANIRIIEACAQRLGFPMEKFFVCIDEYANTSSASIPIALSDMKKKGLLTRGKKIITVGFGGGLTSGGNFFIY